MKVNEFWKEVPGYSNYEASTQGRVRNVTSGHVLSPPLSTSKRRFVRLYPSKSGPARNYTLAKLIIETFLGPSPKEGFYVGHLDGDMDNNALHNLAYEPQSFLRRRFDVSGQKNTNYTKCRPNLTADMLRLRATGMSNNQIRDHFGMANNAAVTKRIGFATNGTNKRLNKQLVKKIKLMLKRGDTQTQIAEVFGVTPSCIGQIAAGKIWAD